MVFSKVAKWLIALSCAVLTGCSDMSGGESRILSGAVMLGPQWTVIAVNPPLAPEKTGQKIQMELEGIGHMEEMSGNAYVLTKDGAPIDIKVELREQNGEALMLVPTSIGRMIGFSLPVQEEGAGFRKSRRFNEVRVSSSRPIKARAIKWYCWDGK